MPHCVSTCELLPFLANIVSQNDNDLLLLITSKMYEIVYHAISQTVSSQSVYFGIEIRLITATQRNKISRATYRQACRQEGWLQSIRGNRVNKGRLVSATRSFRQQRSCWSTLPGSLSDILAWVAWWHNTGSSSIYRLATIQPSTFTSQTVTSHLHLRSRGT